MKFKKFLSMALAAAMALSLTVPASAAKPAKNKNKTETPAVQAIAVDKIEDEDPRLPIVEGGAEIDTANYPAIYIKQANDVAIIVHADDARSDADIIAEARASDKSLAKEGKGATTVIRGTGEVWLHKNATTFVTVANGILTVNGPISHISFGGGKPAPEFPDDDGGEVSAVFQITKFLNDNKTFGEGFIFDIISDETGETVGTMTSDGNGLAAATLSVAPGKYIIREQVDADKYMPVDDVYVTVDETGTAFDDTAFDGSITNVQWGKLEYTTPGVTEEYNELWHTPVYESVGAQGTMVSIPANMQSSSNKNLPAGIVDIRQSGPKNGFTYVEIDKAALANNSDGATIGFVKKSGAMSDEIMAGLTIPTLNPVNPWEPARLATYTLTIKDNTLHFESTMPDFRLTFSDTDHTPAHTGAHEGENIQPNENGVYENDYPISQWGEKFRVIVHYENKGYNTDKVTGCNGDEDHLITRECERPYTGEVTVTVTNEAGKTVTDLTKVAPGAYTVTVTANGQTLNTQTVTVNPGETTTVIFPSDLTVQGADEYHCANPDCDLNKSSAEG